MSNQLSTYTFETHAIRTLSINDEPWFIAKDLCSAINISNYRDAIDRLDDDEKGVALTDTLGGQQEMNIVSESGMYTLILRCRDAVKKGSAPHRFRKWVTSEVLPQIRKTGRYEQQQLALPEPLKFTVELTEHELQQLVWGWFVLTRGIDTMQQIYPAMEKLGSKHSGAIYGQAYEYLNVQREVHKTLMRITDGINADPMNNWRALNHLRAFNSKKRTTQLPAF